MTPPSIARRGLMLTSLVATLVFPFTAPALADVPEYWTNRQGLAIRGYDPVAYFTEGRPIEGLAEYRLEWHGAIWQFASAENRALFTADPMAYAPQFGGYCAWAVSQGYTASVNPNAWDIVDGKLYLNYSTGIQNRWQRDRDQNIQSAEREWPGIVAR